MLPIGNALQLHTSRMVKRLRMALLKSDKVEFKAKNTANEN